MFYTCRFESARKTCFHLPMKPLQKYETQSGLDEILNKVTETKTIGQDKSCDIVLDDDTVSGIHARLDLADDGLISVSDAGSEHGVFLNRNAQWIRVKRVTLCSGDKISFGQLQVPLGQLVSVFGENSRARLERKQVVLDRIKTATGSSSHHAESGANLQKPRRNPVTGKIEEDHSTGWKGNNQKEVDQSQ
jgi:pSer/pThr/pTyr-binding forkhead associated (FHA) protein